MNEEIKSILLPHFQQFTEVASELDLYTFVQNALETGTKIFQMRQDYGLGNHDKDQIAEVWNALYLEHVINRNPVLTATRP